MPVYSKIPSQRLDLLLLERGLTDSREKARRLIMAGEVFIDEEVHDKPGKRVPVDASIRLRETPKYASRGGIKLAAALERLAIDVSGTVVADIGASTGGFTDCLLQHGATQVYAIDVGYGQLAWKLRIDPRVVVIERTNIRHLTQLPGTPAPLVDMAVIDVSFISLNLVLPSVLKLIKQDAQIVALIKPQFEAGKGKVGKGGVVRSEKVHRDVLRDTLASATSMGLVATNLIPSPILGPAGNIEFLVLLTRSPNSMTLNMSQVNAADIEDVLHEASKLRQRA
ncbi:MAG: TlyA family RNA methyltransferase [Chloroflexota bacterium]